MEATESKQDESSAKVLDVEPILNNLLEYLFCKVQLSDVVDREGENETEEEGTNDQGEAEESGSKEVKTDQEVEDHFPYPIFSDFCKIGNTYHLQLFSAEPKKEEGNRRYDIDENISFYKNPKNRLFDFWRINLFQKGRILTNVACLLLNFLKKQEGLTLTYGGEEITFFGTCVIHLKRPDVFSLKIKDKSFGKIQDEDQSSVKTLFIKRRDGESFYIDYSLSTKGDRVNWNEKGFPCNLWRPCTWIGKETKFTMTDLLSGDIVNEAFLENKKEFDDYFASQVEGSLPEELQFIFVNINLYHLRLCEVVMIKHLL